MWPPSRNLVEVELWISNGSAACESSLARNPLPVCTVNPLSGDEWLCAPPPGGGFPGGAKSFATAHARRPPGSRENRGGGARPPTSLPEIEELRDGYPQSRGAGRAGRWSRPTGKPTTTAEWPPEDVKRPAV